MDAVITSPPYMNAIDYLRGHRLALVWLGYSVQDVRNVRSKGIGASDASKRRRSKSVNRIIQTANLEGHPVSVDRTIGRYVRDMMACLRQTRRVLRPGGYAVYVISNSVQRGVEIDTARIIVESAAEAGLHLEDEYTREIPGEHRYLPPPQSTRNPRMAGRMRTESVLRFRNPH